MNAPETGSPTRPTGRRLLAYLPPVLLASVAILQMTLSAVSDLSPWKGGGFGMFASIDGHSKRFIRGHVLAEGRVLPLSLPDDDALGRSITNATTLPSTSRLNDLADSLAGRAWYLDPDTGMAMPGRGAERKQRRRIRPIELRLQAYRVLFLPGSLEVERLLLAEVTRKVP